jgi:branched-chain amino acid transport system substrate-binding protein
MGSYWTGADILIQHIGKKAAWTSSRARRSRWSTTTALRQGAHPAAAGARQDARLRAAAAARDRARRGAEGHLAAGAPEPPDYVLLWGWGVMNSTALKEAQATGYPRDKMYGVWWAGAEPDVKDVGEGAKGYNALALNGSASSPR